MASPDNVLKTALSLNHAVVESWEMAAEKVEQYDETHERTVIHGHARPWRTFECLCPKCGRRCPKDGFKQGNGCVAGRQAAQANPLHRNRTQGQFRVSHDDTPEIQRDLVVEAQKALYGELLQHHVRRTPQKPNRYISKQMS